MPGKTKKDECVGCRLKRTLRNYPDRNYYVPNSPVEDRWICISCANVLGLDDLKRDHVGQLLLTVNSKLDMLLKKGSR